MNSFHLLPTQKHSSDKTILVPVPTKELSSESTTTPKIEHPPVDVSSAPTPKGFTPATAGIKKKKNAMKTWASSFKGNTSKNMSTNAWTYRRTNGQWVTPRLCPLSDSDDESSTTSPDTRV